MMNFFFRDRPSWILPTYRIIFSLGLLAQLYFDSRTFFLRSQSNLCYPIPIFEKLFIPVLQGPSFQLYFYILLGALSFLAIGFLPRFSALVSCLLFFWIVGSTVGCATGKDPVSVPWNHAIIVFNLFVLAVAPSKPENWPIFLLKFNLIYTYFAGALAKLQYGLDWMNGYTMQGQMLIRHLDVGTPQILPFVENFPLMVAVSVIVLVVELSFPLALFNRKLAVVYIGGSLVFQLIFYWLIDLKWMGYFGLSYFIYLLELIAFWKDRRTTEF
jgi:hypothetical protein